MDLNAPEVLAAIAAASSKAAKEAAAAATKAATEAAVKDAEEKERTAKLTAEQAAQEAAKKAEKAADDAKAIAANATKEAALLRSMQRAGLVAQDDVAEQMISARVDAEVKAGADLAAALVKVKSDYGYLFKQPAAPASAPEVASSPAAVAAAATLGTAPAAPAAPRAGAPSTVDCSTMTDEEFRAHEAKLLGRTPRR